MNQKTPLRPSSPSNLKKTSTLVLPSNVLDVTPDALGVKKMNKINPLTHPKKIIKFRSTIWWSGCWKSLEQQTNGSKEKNLGPKTPTSDGCCTLPEAPSHSIIVEKCQLSYSDIVDGHPSWCRGAEKGNYSIYDEYPHGVVNPAFTGMRLWEIDPEQEVNDYQISKHLNIKSGLIIYGNDVYVFTPITNNDITSYIKTISRKKDPTKTFSSLNQLCKSILDYICQNCFQRPIPCIPTIKKKFNEMFGVNQLIVTQSPLSYLELLPRTYIMLYMLHYYIPIQRKKNTLW